jgi:nucleotide-binding universal stress UspA family protein
VSDTDIAGPLVVAYDGSAGATEALRVAVGLAARADLSVVAVFVYEPLDDLDAPPPVDFAARREAAAARHRAELAAATADTDVAAELLVLDGDQPADCVVATARERSASLVVTGSHRSQPLRDLLVGSTAKRILSHADRPVVVVPPPKAAAAG